MRILVFSLLLAMSTFAQGENVLIKARALFADDQAEKALSLVNEHLRVNPEDSDARVLLGLICSWTKRYDEGRRAFEAVLQADPDYKDATLGLVNLELWSGHAVQAEEVIRLGLRYRPDDSDYRAALTKVKAANGPVQTNAQIPVHPSEYNWEAGINQSNIWFSDKRSTWSETSGTLSKNFGPAWVTARFSHASCNFECQIL